MTESGAAMETTMTKTRQETPQAAPAAASTLLQIESLRQIPGCMRGARSPLAAARLAVADAAHWAALLGRTAVLLEPQVPGCIATARTLRSAGASSQVSEQEMLFFTRLLTLLNAFGAQIGLPALDSPQITKLPVRPPEGVTRWMLTLPSYSPRAIGLAFAWLVRLLNDFSKEGENAAWTNERSKQLDALI